MIQFDCHAHVYERVSAVPGARYSPLGPAPLASWIKNLENHDLKGGVIVQVSFLGTDNSELCAALAQLDRARFAGVAVVPFDVDEEELDLLVTCGIRGIRWNLVRGAPIPDMVSPLVQDLFGKLRRKRLHLEVHLEGPRLAKHMDALTDQGVDIVIDHFGLPSDPDPRSDPMMMAVAALPSRQNLYFKFSAEYRSAFDVTPHAKALHDLLEKDRVVWGSDWPHTQHEGAVNYADIWRGASLHVDHPDSDVASYLYGISNH